MTTQKGPHRAVRGPPSAVVSRDHVKYFWPRRATDTGPTRPRFCQADPPGYARPRGTESAFASIVIRLGHDAEVAGFGASRRRNSSFPGPSVVQVAASVPVRAGPDSVR